MAVTMSVLDSTIVNVALPSLAHDFHSGNAASVWVVNAYQVAILMALLPLASLGEIVGYRRIYQWTVLRWLSSPSPLRPALSPLR